MTDDRAEFEARRLEQASKLGADERLRTLDLDVTTAADELGFTYAWSWLGVPVIQMPTDIVATQEIIWTTRPQFIVETGVARGGSCILHASILELIGEGGVVAVDIDIRSHSRESIEHHPLSRRITLIEGSSTADETVAAVMERVSGAERVMVILDSDHTHAHVLDELRRYGPLVTAGQFLVVADTVVDEIPTQAHRPRPWGPGNNPKTAVAAYLAECDRFVVDPAVNDKLVMTSSRGGYLRCVR